MKYIEYKTWCSLGNQEQQRILCYFQFLGLDFAYVPPFFDEDYLLAFDERQMYCPVRTLLLFHFKDSIELSKDDIIKLIELLPA